METTPWGELAAVGAAMIWAGTSIIFTHAGKRATPLAANTFKTVLGSLLFALVLTIREGVPYGRGIAPFDWGMLALSGVVGLSLGDSLLFKGFVILGTRRAMLVFSLNPVIGAVAGYLFLGERLGWKAILGMAVALAGVALVIGEKRPPAPDGLTPPPDPTPLRPGRGSLIARHVTLFGILFALGGGFGQAIGAILAKSSLQRVDTLPATAIRMSAASLGLVILGLVTGKLHHWTRLIIQGRLAARMALASFFGPFLGVYLMVLSLDLAPTGVALTLLATSPIWLLPLGAWFQGDRPSKREAIGAFVALAGVALLMLR
ncbi:MAG: DMT family transporter [Candidatus Eisenbacteria bacterium]